MIRVVIDTNVVVSAVLNPLGSPARVLGLVSDEAIRLLVSASIVSEYEDVLGRGEFGLSASYLEAFFQDLLADAVVVEGAPPLRVSPDPTDDKFLECAAAAEADYLVTGNLKHFPKLLGRIRVVSPAVLLKEVA